MLLTQMGQFPIAKVNGELPRKMWIVGMTYRWQEVVIGDEGGGDRRWMRVKGETTGDIGRSRARRLV